MPPRLAIFVLLLNPALLPAAAPPPVSFTAHGDQLLAHYFRTQAKRIGESALANIRTRADWEKARPELHRQFLDMLGLWPLPKRTDLHATITGRITTPHYIVEKLHFQSIPGLYVSANLYLPRVVKRPCPAVLYVCGHGPAIIDRVSYGNKVTYQHHPAWFAEHGYVCLIVDTLQLGELPGLHHGTSRFGMWWWQALGYTPAGIECWNAMRALDYLESRKEVDRSRLGITGRSGGGATSWWVGAADERVKCIIPVAGIADLLAHLSEGYPGRLRDGVIAGHCDCMYFVNTYRWDFTQVMALCAPRALLLGNSDQDMIFPVPGYRRMAEKVKRLYTLLGAGDRFALLETKGPHKDTPELRLGAFRWMNRWLKNDKGEVADSTRPLLKPQQLKVFDRAPADAINEVVHERFRRPAKLDLPLAPEVAREWWKGKAPELRKALRDRVFRGWPEKMPPLGAKLAAEVKHRGVRLRAYDFLSEEAVPLRLWLVGHEKVARPTEVIASVVDEAGWKEWLGDLGPAFRSALHDGGNLAPRPYPAWNEARFAQHRKVMEYYRWVFAVIAPRGIGFTRWSEVSRFDGKPNGHQIRRRFALLGQTLDGQRVLDVVRAVACLREVKELKDVPLTLQGKGDMAGVALYAALFEPGVMGLDLWHLPASHRKGPTLLNVLTVLDMPQALGLALPRKVKLHVKDEDEAKAWKWTVSLQKALGGEGLKIRMEEE
jgi:cephalosporin-C deacetylase-like acetyl esterase